MDNTPWEPCPRCGSKHVKVIAKRGKQAGSIGTTMMIVGFGIYLIWGLNKFPAKDLAGMFASSLFIAFFGLIAIPVIVAVAGVVALLFSHAKGYLATCQDCFYQWEMTEAEHNHPAPSHTKRVR